jgi:hypothetical protein
MLFEVLRAPFCTLAWSFHLASLFLFGRCHYLWTCLPLCSVPELRSWELLREQLMLSILGTIFASVLWSIGWSSVLSI